MSEDPVTRRLADDLGTPVLMPARPQRVVSLVPSLTEAIAATCPEVLVGATDWCTHPPALEVTRVRGTKNPDLAAVRALEPDLVVTNMEENRELDVARLRESGVSVWVTRIETVEGALVSLRRLLVDALGRPCPPWLVAAEEEWREPVNPRGIRVVVPIWRDPWMVVGRRTFTGDLLAHMGLTHVHAGSGDRYPTMESPDVLAADADLVLLPDEPYLFSEADGPEAFPSTATALVSGRLLTWYGPSLVGAPAVLEGAISRALSAGPRA